MSFLFIKLKQLNNQNFINLVTGFNPGKITRIWAANKLIKLFEKAKFKSDDIGSHKNKEVLILEDFKFSSPKTSDYIKIIKAFGLESKKTLLVTSETNKNIYLSSRNIKNSKVIINSELNTYEITDANNILILESAVEGIETTLK